MSSNPPPSWPMFFAYMNLTGEPKVFPQWPFECFNNRLANTCVGLGLAGRLPLASGEL
jgi:hypothetical protein